MDSDGIISGNHRSIEGVRSAGLSMRLSYETLFAILRRSIAIESSVGAF